MTFGASRTPALGGVPSFLQNVVDGPPLPVPENGADLFVALKLGLGRATGARPATMARHNMDLMLAATAILGDYTLVSNDRLFATLAELEPRLRVEDWTV